jgi:hypothetical protein
MKLGKFLIEDWANDWHSSWSRFLIVFCVETFEFLRFALQRLLVDFNSLLVYRLGGYGFQIDFFLWWPCYEFELVWSRARGWQRRGLHDGLGSPESFGRRILLFMLFLIVVVVDPYELKIQSAEWKISELYGLGGGFLVRVITSLRCVHRPYILH